MVNDRIPFPGFQRLSFLTNGSFYDIDQGAVPDYPITRPASFFDRGKLTDYINNVV